MEEKITVIIPVFNVEKYLSKCVNSILIQSYKNWEVILIDDGSTDKSGRMCDEFAKNNTRITVIHKKNGGLSAARNDGLDWMFLHSDSRWVTFLDSDDWVHPNYLSELAQANTEHGTRVSISYLEKVYDESAGSVDYSQGSVAREIDDAFFLPDGWIDGYACGKLIDRSLFADVRFPVGRAWEDLSTMFRVVLEVPYVSVIAGKLYYYRQVSTSIVHQKWSLKRLDEIRAYEELLEYIAQRKMNTILSRAYHTRSMCLYGQLGLLDSLPPIEHRQYKRYRKIITRGLLISMLQTARTNSHYVWAERRFIVSCVIRCSIMLSAVRNYTRKIKMWRS